MQNAELEEEESEENGVSFSEGDVPDLFKSVTLLNMSYFCVTSCQTC